MNHALVLHLKTKSQTQGHIHFSSTLSCRHLVVLNFTFKSTVQFELPFVNDIKYVLMFSFVFAYGCVLKHHLKT